MMTTRPTRTQPLLVDNSLNRAFSLKYAIYAVFGLSGVVTHIPSLSIVAGEFAASVLAFFVMVSSVLASIASWHYLKGGVWPKRELYATIVTVSFMAMYAIALIILAILGVGDRANLAIIAIALLVMPCWRIKFLLKNAR